MKYQIELQKKFQKRIKRLLNRLNIMYVKSNEKVAYYYEDMKTQTIFSFNASTTFYAASAIKILIAVYIYEKKIDLNQSILITADDIKQGSGILKNENNFPQNYSLQKLLKYTIKYSDNTAYLKLVNWIGKENLIKFGKSLGAKHTLEGKDSFGITTCNDLACYWKAIWPIQKEHEELREWLQNPTYQMIQEKNLRNKTFLRKYGLFDIACHEAGIVLDENPYYLFILTQKGQTKSKMKFLNKTAKKISKIHMDLRK